MPSLSPRRLIVNADDFGRDTRVNEAVSEACERGILTTASLMVNESAAADAVRIAKFLERRQGFTDLVFSADYFLFEHAGNICRLRLLYPCPLFPFFAFSHFLPSSPLCRERSFVTLYDI